ncbi:condensation domain-containing protein [Nocardia sp. AG03]|uniref:condensation domain-containing protein n=1 Tax=Nocardia sp. AG03 TaxID=3025312 RepID=UPI002418632E|nr:condensation domain-containing protein [Nocardia sp. AG03]
MAGFGLLEAWHPATGRLVSWHASAAAVAWAARAPRHPVPPSHQQEQYLAAAYRHREAAFRFSGLCVATTAMPGPLDRAAMTRAVNALLRRHDTFHSWFDRASDGSVGRHLIDPARIDFVPVDHGTADGNRVRAHVRQSTPGPFEWHCFTFGAIEHGESTTLYLAVDRLHTDVAGQYLSCFELAHLYLREIGRAAGTLTRPASFVDHCARERAASAELTRTSPGVRRWLELLRGNHGELPTFPVDLGRAHENYHRSAHRTIDLFDEATALRFEKICREHGAEFTGGVFAAAALTERELVDSDYYFALSPVSTRSSVAELTSVGWYVTLIPVAFPIGAATTFARALATAQRAYEHGRTLAPVSPHRVLELAADDPDIAARPGWAAPTISYIDARDATGGEYVTGATTGVYAHRVTTEEILLWIDRRPTTTTLSALYPDTPTAHRTVDRYLHTLRTTFITATRH